MSSASICIGKLVPVVDYLNKEYLFVIAVTGFSIGFGRVNLALLK